MSARLWEFWMRIGHGAALLCAMSLAAEATPAQPAASPTLAQLLAYPVVSDLVAAEHADRIAWVETVKGVRNVWAADGPGFTPRMLTHATADDGQELTGLTFSPDGSTLLYVRGGDHDENWPAEGGLQPDPTSDTEQPKVTIWKAPLTWRSWRGRACPSLRCGAGRRGTRPKASTACCAIRRASPARPRWRRRRSPGWWS